MNKLKIDCIIQARMGSERLPGKVLFDLTDGKKIIEFLVEQLSSSNIQQKIVAIPDNETDNILFDFLNNLKISCYRGSTFDVLDRYYTCAKKFSFKNIMRITGDNPLHGNLQKRSLKENMLRLIFIITRINLKFIILSNNKISLNLDTPLI